MWLKQYGTVVQTKWLHPGFQVLRLSINLNYVKIQSYSISIENKNSAGLLR